MHTIFTFWERQYNNRKMSKFGFDTICANTDSCVHAKFSENLYYYIKSNYQNYTFYTTLKTLIFSGSVQSHWSVSTKNFTRSLTIHLPGFIRINPLFKKMCTKMHFKKSLKYRENTAHVFVDVSKLFLVS